MNYLRKIFCRIFLGISRDSGLRSGAVTDINQDNENIYENRGEPSSELIFQSDYFRLIGNDPLKEAGVAGKWYLERIVSYCERTGDPNMIAALRKIASSKNADEALRHHAAGLADKLEDNKRTYNILKGKDDSKTLNAMILLSGSRTPQTTEILRLLRDKSISSKRYAILMIGKFRLADLAGEVCDCLPIQPLTRISADVLKSFGSAASSDLIALYMNQSGNKEIGRIIVNLLGKTGNRNDTEFIFSLLWSNIREIRFIAATILSTNLFTAGEEREEKVTKLISEAIGVIVWNMAAGELMAKSGKANMVRLLDDEISEWKSFIINLLSISTDKDAVDSILKYFETNTLAATCCAMELIDKYIDESVKDGVTILFDGNPSHKKLKRLTRKWPVRVSENLFEDIINRDYNLINTWTKAAALHCMEMGDNGTAAESVMALLFSPMKLLREEAALALVRSGRSLPEELVSRLPDEMLSGIREITGERIQNQNLFYNRVTFLAGLFPEIPPEELIILADSLNYYRNEDIADTTLVNSIAWETDDNLIVGRCCLTGDGYSINTLLSESGTAWISLPLHALDNFLLVNQGRTAVIYDYLDRNAAVTVSV